MEVQVNHSIYVVDDLSREQEIKQGLFREINVLRDVIRVLKTGADQSETVIAEIQPLRRNVNSLLERSLVQLLVAEQDRRHPNTGPVRPITVEKVSAPHPVDPKPLHRPEEPDTSSFSKLSELLTRLERLETSIRGPLDHRHQMRRRSCEHNSRKYQHHGRGDPGGDSSTNQSLHRRRDGSSFDKSSSADDNRHRKSRRTPPRDVISARRVSAIEASSP